MSTCRREGRAEGGGRRVWFTRGPVDMKGEGRSHTHTECAMCGCGGVGLWRGVSWTRERCSWLRDCVCGSSGEAMVPRKRRLRVARAEMDPQRHPRRPRRPVHPKSHPSHPDGIVWCPCLVPCLPPCRDRFTGGLLTCTGLSGLSNSNASTILMKRLLIPLALR